MIEAQQVIVRRVPDESRRRGAIHCIALRVHRPGRRRAPRLETATPREARPGMSFSTVPKGTTIRACQLSDSSGDAAPRGGRRRGGTGFDAQAVNATRLQKAIQVRNCGPMQRLIQTGANRRSSSSSSATASGSCEPTCSSARRMPEPPYPSASRRRWHNAIASPLSAHARRPRSPGR